MFARTRTTWLLLAAPIGCVAAWSAWRWNSSHYRTWKEDVRLSDGRVIVVTQKHEVYEDYGTNRSWVTFSLPEMADERTWHSYLKPMRVDVYDGRVFVVGRPHGPRQFQYYRYPKHYLVSFVLIDGAFVRIPLMHVPEAIRREENIFPCVPSLAAPLLSSSEKRRAVCQPHSEGHQYQFGRRIDQAAYDELAISMARLSGGPLSRISKL